MKRIISRIKHNSGFTLAETLMAVLILSMVTGIAAVGVPAATSAYKNAVDASHAQVLLSTTMTALRDELSTAKKVTPASGSTTISYTDENGLESVITVKGDGIYLKKTRQAVSSDDTTEIERLLVSKEAATSNMYATFTSSSSSDSIVTISGLSVKRGTSTIADLGLDYKIRVLGIVDEDTIGE